MFVLQAKQFKLKQSKRIRVFEKRAAHLSTSYEAKTGGLLFDFLSGAFVYFGWSNTWRKRATRPCLLCCSSADSFCIQSKRAFRVAEPESRAERCVRFVTCSDRPRTMSDAFNWVRLPIDTIVEKESSCYLNRFVLKWSIVSIDERTSIRWLPDKRHPTTSNVCPVTCYRFLL